MIKYVPNITNVSITRISPATIKITFSINHARVIAYRNSTTYANKLREARGSGFQEKLSRYYAYYLLSLNRVRSTNFDTGARLKCEIAISSTDSVQVVTEHIVQINDSICYHVKSLRGSYTDG